MSRDPISDLAPALAAMPGTPNVVVRGGVEVAGRELQAAWGQASAAAIVRALAEVPHRQIVDGEGECATCRVVLGPLGPGGFTASHAPTCPWARAVAWCAANPANPARDVDPDVEPPLWDDGPGDPADRVR